MIIGVVNNKGGVLKTTLSTNFGACLSVLGKKTIIVDLDGQGNVAATFGKNPYTLQKTIMDLVKEETTNHREIVFNVKPNLDLLMGNDELNYFDILLNKSEIKIASLKNLLLKLNEEYDYVVIDTPPNMSTIVACVLSVVNVVLIPFEPDQYAILGLKRIVDASQEFMAKNSRDIKIIAVPTKVNNRVTIHKEIIEDNIKPKLSKQNVFIPNNQISSSTRSTASVGYERVPIVFSIVKSKYQDEYHELTKEILNYISTGENNGER